MDDFPALDLTTWHKTRDTLQIYAKLLGKIQQSLIPAQRHFWHYGLVVSENGIKTQDFDGKHLLLNLKSHQLELIGAKASKILSLAGQTASTICEQALIMLENQDVNATIDQSLFTDSKPLVYVPSQAEQFAVALSHIADLTKAFKAELKGESSPVQLFPHHFDLSLTWFSGRKVPGKDPDDEDASDESVGFGFSTGDEDIPEAYLYVTAYPTPNKWNQAELP